MQNQHEYPNNLKQPLTLVNVLSQHNLTIESTNCNTNEQNTGCSVIWWTVTGLTPIQDTVVSLGWSLANCLQARWKIQSNKIKVQFLWGWHVRIFNYYQSAHAEVSHDSLLQFVGADSLDSHVNSPPRMLILALTAVLFMGIWV